MSMIKNRLSRKKRLVHDPGDDSVKARGSSAKLPDTSSFRKQSLLVKMTRASIGGQGVGSSPGSSRSSPPLRTTSNDACANGGVQDLSSALTALSGQLKLQQAYVEELAASVQTGGGRSAVSAAPELGSVKERCPTNMHSCAMAARIMMDLGRKNKEVAQGQGASGDAGAGEDARQDPRGLNGLVRQGGASMAEGSDFDQTSLKSESNLGATIHDSHVEASRSAEGPLGAVGGDASILPRAPVPNVGERLRAVAETSGRGSQGQSVVDESTDGKGRKRCSSEDSVRLMIEADRESNDNKARAPRQSRMVRSGKKDAHCAPDPL